ncbi:MAG: Protein FecR [Pseudomonas citronellolis]|nr:MAG: Protein FecR [Pseudomonas citronellolis]
MPSPALTPVVAMAEGLPLDSRVADEAADWLTLLMSGEMSAEQHQQLHAWRLAHPDHARAWRHIEALGARFKGLEPQAAYQALSVHADLKSPARRQLLNLLLWGGAVGASALLTSRTRLWQTRVADYRTDTGEQRWIELGDGTRILLDTGSAIDVDYSASERQVRLVAGNILLITGHREVYGEAERRPFTVETRDGRIRALGTRFSVRLDEARTSVAVAESAVEITPRDAPAEHTLLRQGERATCTRSRVQRLTPLGEHDLAWTRGQIVADDLRLEDFLAELSRYRPGILRCDPAVADLRFSGVFPLQDTDRILRILPTVLPVSVQLRTRYWVTVLGRTG